MSNFYAALDVSDQQTAVCIIDGKGDTKFEGMVATDPQSIARSIRPYGRMLKVVGLETGSKSAWLYKELSRKHYPVACLDARLAHGSLGTQRNKTDKNDARALAQLLRLGWSNRVYVKSDEALRMRLLLTYRRALKRKAISLEMTLRMSLKVFGGSITKKARSLTVRLDKRDATISTLTGSLLRARAALLKEAEVLDGVVVRTAEHDPVCRRLMTVPGVGPITALSFRAAVDDPMRFPSSRSVAAYFGLTPRRRQSGQTDITGRISRMGDGAVRSALYEAAVCLIARSKSNSALRLWALRLREEKGTRKAAVALARKLAVVMHRMWISRRDFDPHPRPSPSAQ